MEESPDQQDIHDEKDNKMQDLEAKINFMWKTINDLKIKVMEDKELLKKEKNENERIMEEQVRLRKQLSMFHLPHCPAYSTPPCPLHSLKPQTFSASESRFDKRIAYQQDGIVGNHGDNVENQSFQEFLHSLNHQSEVSLENLFEECRKSKASIGVQNQTSDFTLLLSQQWQSRITAANSRSKESSLQNVMFDQRINYEEWPKLFTPDKHFDLVPPCNRKGATVTMIRLLQCVFDMFSKVFWCSLLLYATNFNKHFIYGNNHDSSNEKMLVDFTTMQTLTSWVEISDVIRNIGKSKAVLSLQKTHKFQRAVLFTMLNPQPDGAGFAGFRFKTEFNLTAYQSLQLLCRGQGDYYGYKAVLRHNREPFPLFEHMFQAPFRKFEVVTLQLNHFEPYYRGRRQVNSDPLNKKNITSLELHVYGGVYLPVKQSGTASLEVDWIKAV